MNVKVINDGVEQECNILFTFKDEQHDIDYIVYNEGTRDFRLEEEIFASRYIIENGEYILSNIEYDYEWDLIDKMLELKCKEIEI